MANLKTLKIDVTCSVDMSDRYFPPKITEQLIDLYKRKAGIIPAKDREYDDLRMWILQQMLYADRNEIVAFSIDELEEE